MVTIQTDQPVPAQEHLRVIQGREYEDVELVEVYHKDDPTRSSLCAFQAHFIAHGHNVGEEPHSA
jgi:hypothetical protein